MENAEFKSFNHIINNTKFSILEHGYLHAGCDWEFRDLNSPFNRMYFIIEGSGRIYNKVSSLELGDGKVCLIPLGESFDYVCDDYLHMFYIHFRIELMSGHDLFDGERACLVEEIDVEVIKQLITSAKSTKVADVIRCKGLFYDYIARFIMPLSDALNEHVEMMGDCIHIYEYVKDHCYANLRVNDIAEHFGINVSTFSKHFKHQTGVTLKGYIDRKLIQKAQEQLLVTDLTIRKIAYGLKFSDEFHFSRYFKKHVGFSPSNYRQRNNTYK